MEAAKEQACEQTLKESGEVESVDAQPRGHGISRRGMLTGLGALAGAQLVRPEPAFGARPATNAAAHSAWKHAVGDPRGSAIAVKVGRSQEGRFGVMFKKLDPYSPPDSLLRALAGQMGEANSNNPTDLDNPSIPAGFTFLGQFIDHDMTLDRTPIPSQQTDPHALTNFDTPFFDLGSIYGRGPTLDPQLYEPNQSGRLLVVKNAEGVDDLPRTTDGVAKIGDARNDENLILSQLHLAFMKFHNRCLTSGIARSFAEAQRLTRWHFQWIIVHDYLRHNAGQNVVDRFLKTMGNGKPRVTREFYKPKNALRPMMPVEYSVAAFRFGHSMVRAAYLLHQRNGTPSFVPIFGAPGRDLRGSQPLPARLEIDWEHFFVLRGRSTAQRNQSRLIDGKLALPLFNLPSTIVNDAMVSLAERNLIRGKRLGLPSGQAVARAMGVRPLSNAELGLPTPSDRGWGGEAPLWFYILKESELSHGGQLLGPVGGRLVAEVILGILDSDKSSYLNASHAFRPVSPIAPQAGTFTTGDLITFTQSS